MDSTGTQTREPGDVQINGTVADGYELVRDAFAANFAERGEIGASVAVVAGGETVVNLWAGWADPAGTQPWQAGTLTNVWSTTKAMTSLCVAILMDRAGLDPDTPVARYWLEFAAAGKADIPLRWVLTHRSGLSGLATPVTVADYLDWEKITCLLAAQQPLWEPGTASGYHAITFGFLVGEVIRRVTGQTLGEFFAAEVARPLDADFYIGLPEADLPRCGSLQGVRPSEEEQSALAAAYANAHPAALAALLNPALTGDEANDPGWRRAEIPAANGHGTARPGHHHGLAGRRVAAADQYGRHGGHAGRPGHVSRPGARLPAGVRPGGRAVRPGAALRAKTRPRSGTTGSAARPPAPTRRRVWPSPT
jgi:CubicO group peptidase (beta-lactamase class C family)